MFFISGLLNIAMSLNATLTENTSNLVFLRHLHQFLLTNINLNKVSTGIYELLFLLFLITG